MKRMALFCSLFSFALALADYSLSANVSCNSPGNVKVSGIPENACVAYAQNIAVGINPQDGTYFFDIPDIVVTVSESSYINMRFVVSANSVAYKSVQALTQTALASGAAVNLIFSNPNLVASNCYRYAEIGNLVCPLQAIEISK